jgi:hypothetical protein
MENTVEIYEYMDSSAPGDSDKGSRLEALQTGATGWDPAEQGESETPLTGGGGGTSNSQQSKLGEPGGPDGEGGHSWPPSHSKNQCGAAKKRARKARLVEAPSGDSGCGQPRSALGDQPHTMQ